MTSAEDLEPHIKELRGMDDVEEVRILGNTLGIGACKLLGEVLSTKKNLQVRTAPPPRLTPPPNKSLLPDRELRRHLHGSPPQRDPRGPQPPPQLRPQPPQALHRRPERQRLRHQHPRAARRVPLPARPPPAPLPQQQRPRPALRHPRRRLPLQPPREEGGGSQGGQGGPGPRDGHLRAQPPRERVHDGLGQGLRPAQQGEAG